MGVQSIARAVGIGSAPNLLRLPVESIGNRSFNNSGDGPRAIAAHLRTTIQATRENFIAEAATKAGVLQGVGQLVNEGVGAPPNANQNILRLTAGGSQAGKVQEFIRGPR